MISRMLKTSGFSVLCRAGILILPVLPTGLFAQQPPVATANFDPSDVYLQGFLSVRASEKLEQAGDFIGAREKLTKATELFATIQKFHPEWNPGMVKSRSEKTTEAIARVDELAQKQLARNRTKMAELEGGEIKSGKPAQDIDPSSNPGVLEVNPVAARKLKEAQAEVDRLRKLVEQKEAAVAKERKAGQVPQDALERERRNRERLEGAVAAEKQARERLETALAREQEALKQKQAATNEEEIRKREDALAANEDARRRLEAEVERERAAKERLEADIAKERAAREKQETASDRETRERLRSAESTVKSLRAQLLAAPMAKDMLALDRRIKSLEEERDTMAMSLGQSQKAHAEAITRIGNLEAELKTMQQQRAELDQNLKTERETANTVVAGQRRQLDDLEKQLQTKTSELAMAHEKISGLMRELKESRDAFTELRTERDSLLLERDQMAALLKLNEGGQIQDLIEQNMALARQLRESNEKVEAMEREGNADKDAYTEALRDLAIAKTQINGLLKEKREQDKRLKELRERLENEEQALVKGEVVTDPAEVEVLRDIIKRQLSVQEFRRQARDLLVEATRNLGKEDERLAKAIELFDQNEIALSPEEQRLVVNKEVDGEFISPFARDRASVADATVELNRDIKAFERTAEKSFLAGRFLSTRELYETILEQHPGHTPALCKLGVVHLKLNEPSEAADAFRRAVELDANNAYAYRMLGFAQMQLGELPAAEKSVARAVELAPADAKSQMLLGTLYFRLGRKGEAESHFKAAITADPLPSEPYYNLALIASRDKRMDEARRYYEQALERQAVPDPELEELMAKP